MRSKLILTLFIAVVSLSISFDLAAKTLADGLTADSSVSKNGDSYDWFVNFDPEKAKDHEVKCVVVEITARKLLPVQYRAICSGDDVSKPLRIEDSYAAPYVMAVGIVTAQLNLNVIGVLAVGSKGGEDLEVLSKLTRQQISVVFRREQRDISEKLRFFLELFGAKIGYEQRPFDTKDDEREGSIIFPNYRTSDGIDYGDVAGKLKILLNEFFGLDYSLLESRYATGIYIWPR